MKLLACCLGAADIKWQGLTTSKSNSIHIVKLLSFLLLLNSWWQTFDEFRSKTLIKIGVNRLSYTSL